MPTDEPSPRSQAVGQTIADRYKLLALIGTGGMGAVYEAERILDGQRVALKLIDAEWLRESGVATRFAREARAASALASAHIVSIYDAGTDGERPYLAMELLRGEDLGARMRRLGKIPQAEALEILAQTLQGLADAHEAGVIHRDLKPDNVFLVTDEEDVAQTFGPNTPRGSVRAVQPELLVKIVDFGVSKIERLESGTAPLALTQKGMVLGTPLYMAPEQAQAQEIDVRVDIYSAGAILFEALVGRPPHVGETYEQIIMSICMTDAPDIRKIDPSMPEGIARFLARALHRDRAKRFKSVRQMLVALSELRGVLRAEAKKNPAPVAATIVSAGVSAGVPSEPKASVPSASGGDAVGDPRRAPSSRREPSAKRVPSKPELAAPGDAGWSSASRRGAAEPPPPSSNVTSTRRLVTVGIGAAVAGAIATVALVTALRSPHEAVASPTADPAVSSPTSLTPVASTTSAQAPLGAIVALPASSAAVDIDASRAVPASTHVRPVRSAKSGAAKGGDLELQRDFP